MPEHLSGGEAMTRRMFVTRCTAGTAAISVLPIRHLFAQDSDEKEGDSVEKIGSLQIIRAPGAAAWQEKHRMRIRPAEKEEDTRAYQEFLDEDGKLRKDVKWNGSPVSSHVQKLYMVPMQDGNLYMRTVNSEECDCASNASIVTPNGVFFFDKQQRQPMWIALPKEVEESFAKRPKIQRALNVAPPDVGRRWVFYISEDDTLHLTPSSQDAR